jgi:hypothetical protein
MAIPVVPVVIGVGAGVVGGTILVAGVEYRFQFRSPRPTPDQQARFLELVAKRIPQYRDVRVEYDERTRLLTISVRYRRVPGVVRETTIAAGTKLLHHQLRGAGIEAEFTDARKVRPGIEIIRRPVRVIGDVIGDIIRPIRVPLVVIAIILLLIFVMYVLMKKELLSI